MCQALITNIHQKKYGDKMLYCSGIVSVTPRKSDSDNVIISTTSLNVPAIESDSATQAYSEVGLVNAPPVSVPVHEGSSGSLFQPPAAPSQMERRKSVKDLVTDFSSCISTSGEEESCGDPRDAVTRRKKKKRKASNSPLLDKIDQGMTSAPLK